MNMIRLVFPVLVHLAVEGYWPCYGGDDWGDFGPCGLIGLGGLLEEAGCALCE